MLHTKTEDDLSLGHTRSRDHRIARVVTNLGDVDCHDYLGPVFGIYLRSTVNVIWKNAFYDWL